MGAMPNEPSMEEILSSIKRIIAEEDTVSQAPRVPRRAAQAVAMEDADDAASHDQVLELTDALPGDSDAAPAQEEPVMTAPAAKPESKPAKTAPRAKAATAPNADTPATVISDASAQAARDSLVNLSRLLVRPEDGHSNTLEGLVREMLRPMLKEWLDDNLPELVEGMVKREIDRITGRV
jgi:cell pole-organizing protein PopZ